MKKEYHILVKGLVQGVSFRALVKERAQRYQLCGYVKNLVDNSVEICLQGEEGIIQQFLQHLKEDSGFARIESMSTKVEESKNVFSSFSILR
jgi:acylphosphatase